MRSSRREGTARTGRIDQRNVIVDLENRRVCHRTSRSEMRRETGMRIKCYVVEVRKMTGSARDVTRTHPGLLRRLLELEVPEISEVLWR